MFLWILYNQGGLFLTTEASLFCVNHWLATVDAAPLRMAHPFPPIASPPIVERFDQQQMP